MVRYSPTSAQKAARVWQQSVNECEQMLKMYADYIAAGHKLSQYDEAVQRRNKKTLDRLMAENPNEPV